MGSPIESFAAVLAIVAAVWGVGRPLARFLAREADPLATGLWSIALGMIAWQSALAVFVASHCWHVAPTTMLTLLGAAWAVVEATAWLVPRFASSAHAGVSGVSQPRIRLVAALAELFARPPLLGPALVAASIALAVSLSPPTRAIGPTEILAEAHRVAASGSADSLAHGLLTPGVGATLLYAWADSIADPGAVCFLNWLAGLFFACAAAAVAAPVLGSRHALTAGAIALVTPAVVGRLTFPSHELAPAGLLLLSAAAWWRASVEFGGRRWYALAALAASGAIGPAWVFAMALILVWAHAQSPPETAASRRLAAVRGALVSSGGLAGSIAPAMLAVCLLAAVISGGAWQLLAECSSRSALGCGPFLLAAAPGLWWTRRLRGMRRLALKVGALVAGAAVLSPATGALVLAALLAIAAAWVWVELERFPGLQRGLARAALAILAMTTIGTTLAGEAMSWPPGLSIANREQYLSERLGCYRATEVANEIVRSGDNLLTNDPQTYWIRCQVTDLRAGPDSPPDAGQADAGQADARPISSWLRERHITHLLLVDPPPESDSAEAGRVATLVDRELAADADGELVPLVEYVKPDGDGKRRYRLIAVRREPKSKTDCEPASGDRSEQMASRNTINDGSQQPARRR